MPVNDSPEFNRDSPLDMLAGSRASRTSLASVSSENGILDAFPLPNNIEGRVEKSGEAPAPEPRTATQPATRKAETIKAPETERDSKSQYAIGQFAGQSTGHHRLGPANSEELVPHRTHERHLRYGHAYNNAHSSHNPHSSHNASNPHNASNAHSSHNASNANNANNPRSPHNAYSSHNSHNSHSSAHSAHSAHDTYGNTYGNAYGTYGPAYGRAIGPAYDGSPGYHVPAQSLNNVTPSPTRIPLLRSHSASRSWDAGTRFSFPPAPVVPAQTWQEQIAAGSVALAEHDAYAARAHWTAAASPPWNNALAVLLVELALSEQWFAGAQGPIPDLSAIDVDAIRKYTAPITGRIITALVNYAAKIKGAQYDVEALKCYEAAAALGLRDAAVAAAQIYLKGSRRIKRDAGRAQRLFDYANSL